MNKKLENRCYDVNLEMREGNGSATIFGQPVVYSSRADLGYFDEIIEPGALDNADLNDVRLCLNHDTSFVYARSRRNNPNSTMRLRIAPSGLEIEADLALEESPKARDLYTSIKRGDIDKMSFMFSVTDEEWEDLDSDHPTRHIRSIGSVVEVSAVTFPAYDSTEIYARSKEALESARSAVETARRQIAETVDTDSRNKDLELARAKFELKSIM